MVPREALVVVGTFDLREGRIMVTGGQSERAVAAWIGVPHLCSAELSYRPAAFVLPSIFEASQLSVTGNRPITSAVTFRFFASAVILVSGP